MRYIINGQSASVRLALELIRKDDGSLYGHRYCDIEDVARIVSELNNDNYLKVGNIAICDNYGREYRKAVNDVK